MANLNLGAGQTEWGHPLAGEGGWRPGEVSYSGFARSEELGRQMAMKALLANPERRRQAEQIWGLAYVRNRYPELYAILKDGD